VILQVLKAFDNPEGAIFSADGSHVFVSVPRPVICPKPWLGRGSRTHVEAKANGELAMVTAVDRRPDRAAEWASASG
jgi:hypothetical protein